MKLFQPHRACLLSGFGHILNTYELHRVAVHRNQLSPHRILENHRKHHANVAPALWSEVETRQPQFYSACLNLQQGGLSPSGQNVVVHPDEIAAFGGCSLRHLLLCVSLPDCRKRQRSKLRLVLNQKSTPHRFCCLHCLSFRGKLLLGADALGSALSVNVITEEPRFALSVQKDASCLKSFSAWLHLLNSLSAGQSGRESNCRMRCQSGAGPD